MEFDNEFSVSSFLAAQPLSLVIHGLLFKSGERWRFPGVSLSFNGVMMPKGERPTSSAVDAVSDNLVSTGFGSESPEKY